MTDELTLARFHPEFPERFSALLTNVEQEALDRLGARLDIRGFVIFGSVARNEHIPGRDLDVIGLTEGVTQWTYQPTSEGSCCLDLNLCSEATVSKVLADDWRWKLNLSIFACLGECGELPRTLEKNRLSLRKRRSTSLMTKRLLGIADEQWALFDDGNAGWVSQAAGLRALTQLADAMIWHAGGVPYRYYGHIEAVSGLPWSRNLRERYLEVLERAASRQVASVPQALAGTDLGGHLQFETRLRLQLLGERYHWLAHCGARTEAMLELRKGLWSWTVQQVCKSTSSQLPGDWRRWNALVATHRHLVPRQIAAVLSGHGCSRGELTELWQELRRNSGIL